MPSGNIPDDPDSPAVRRGVASLVMALAFYRLSQTVVDPDIVGHLELGRRLWETRAVVQPDVYSFVTAGQAWLDHEWLAETLFYLVHAAAGAPGLIGFKLAIGLTICTVLYRHLRGQRIPAVRAAIIVLIVVLLLVPGLITVRPHMFTSLFFPLTLLILHRADAGHVRTLWLAPPLFALWANLHPGFFAGLAVLVLWAAVSIGGAVAAGRGAGGPHPPLARIVLAVVASALATALNPFGFALIVFLLRTATVPRPDITEWQPLAVTSLLGVNYLVLVALAALGLRFSRRARSRALMAVLVVTMALPLVAVRHLQLAATAIVVLGGEHIGDAWDRLASGGGRWPRGLGRPARGRAWLAAACLVVAVAAAAAAAPRLGCLRFDPRLGASLPVRAVALLKDSGVQANLVVPFGWGFYALGALAPAVKVSVDGRRETMYRGDLYLQSLRFMYGEGTWDAILTEYPTDLALVATGSAPYNLMKLRTGWRLIYEDPLSALFGRESSSAVIGALQRTALRAVPPDGAGQCLP